MSAHALVRLSGHGLRFVPFPPYRLSRLKPDAQTPADSFQMVRVHEGEVRMFELRPGAKDAPPAELARLDEAPEGWVVYRMGPRGAEIRLRAGLLPRLDADGSLLEGPPGDEWTVETTVFRCAWPQGLTLASTEPGAPSPFEFYGPEASVIFMQGPYAREQLPELEQMVAPGQNVLGIGSTGGAQYVDVAYEHDGVQWRQRHVVLALSKTHAMVLTAQAHERHMAQMAGHADVVVASFRPGAPA